MRKLIRILTLLLAVLVIQQTSLKAQTSGAVSGNVTDTDTKQPLPGATIFIKGTTNGTITDIYGDYTLFVPGGKSTVVFTFLGYETEEIEVDIQTGSIEQLNVALTADIMQMKEIIISDQALGQMGAINQQINANSIVNVVSKDRIQSLPDNNAAESVGRLPGISIQRDGGEAQKVVVRGLSPRFNAITFNGERLPSTDPEDRSVDLSFLSPEQLQGIEVYKSLRPDMDGDAIGGTVNFIAKKAPLATEFDVRLQGGYNNVSEEFANYRASVAYNQRYFNNKLGMVLTGNYQRADRSSEQTQADWNRPFEVIDLSAENIVLDNSNFIFEEKIRYRGGGSIGLDYAFNPSHSLFLNVAANNKRDEEVRRRRQQAIQDDRMNYDIRDRERSTWVVTSTLSGDHKIFNNTWKLNWRGSYSSSNQETPYSHQLSFREESAFVIPAGGAPTNAGPEFYDEIANNDYTGAYLRRGGARLRRDKVDEAISTISMDLQKDFSNGRNFAGFIKFGGKFRYFDRVNDAIEFRDNGNGPNAGLDDLVEDFPNEYTLSTAVTNQIGMTDFIKNLESSSLITRNIQFGPWLNASEARRFETLWSDRYYFRRDLIDNEDYNAQESISAAYAMTELRYKKLVFLGGLRFEYFNGDYTGFETSSGTDDEDEEEANVTLIERTNLVYYAEVLPQFNLKYNFTDWFDVRAAVTKSLSRPNFKNLVPWRAVNSQENTLRQGNPFLRHMTSWNYDLFLSFYNRFGMITLGYFYKELQNVDVQAQFKQNNPFQDFVGFEVDQPINVDGTSQVQGLEVDIQTNFSSLNNFMRGLLLSVNFTFIDSRTFYPFFDRLGDNGPVYLNSIFDNAEREGSVPGQPDFVSNITLGYEIGGFSGRFSLLLQDRIFDELGETALDDTFTRTLTRLDFTARQKITSDFEIFANFNNITENEDASFIFTEDFVSRSEFYGFTFDVGLRYKFTK